eukprot:PhF_6_TR18578/c0_g1_i2/m.27140/K03025/RPC6, POLR3F; DNA-directed RNA polymerase III subunit RPC6
MSEDVTESLILQAVSRTVDGMSEQSLSDELTKDVGIRQFKSALRMLMISNRVLQFKKNGEMYYKVPVESKPLTGSTGGKVVMSDVQMAVLNLIECSGDRGATTAEIKSKLRMQTKDVTKALKFLTDNKVVKRVKSIENKQSVLYMAAGVEPAGDISGGKWYTANQEFDTQFVLKLRQACLEITQEQRIVSAEQILQKLSAQALSRESLMASDVTQLLNTLVLDGLLEVVCDARGGDGTLRYKLCLYPLSHDALTSTPCGSCPHLKHCSPSGVGITNPGMCV